MSSSIHIDSLTDEFARELKKVLGRHLQEIILFGSRARGEATAGSDYDFVVVVDDRRKEWEEVVLDKEVEMMNRYGALFVSLVHDRPGWERQQHTPLGQNILREGVRV
jgi:predicted nucleotidyltransferase